jgi:hypothetical protein
MQWPPIYMHKNFMNVEFVIDEKITPKSHKINLRMEGLQPPLKLRKQPTLHVSALICY